jgi:hypothetical protein
MFGEMGSQIQFAYSLIHRASSAVPKSVKEKGARINQWLINEAGSDYC